jgi:hypothetical protein
VITAEMRTRAEQVVMADVERRRTERDAGPSQAQLNSRARLVRYAVRHAESAA